MEFDTVDAELASLWLAIFAAFSLVVLLATLGVWFVLTVGTTTVFLPMADLPTAAKIGVSALAVFVNLIFSSGLVYLYLRQTQTQEEQEKIAARQASIQERQQEIMEADYIPAVGVHVDDVSQNSIRIKCVNEGTGLAKNVRVDIEFFVSQNSMDGPGEIHEGVELQRLSDIVYTHSEKVPNYSTREFEINYRGGATVPRREENDNSFASARSQEIIRETRSKMLEFSVYLERSSGPGEEPTRLSFQDGVKGLQDEGVETLGYSMSVSYDDIFGDNVEEKHLASGWVDIRDGVSLRELIEVTENRGISRYYHPFRSEEVISTIHYSYI